MDSKQRPEVKRFTHRYLQGYEHGTEMGESYEEYLLLSERPLVRGNPLSNYNLRVVRQYPDIAFFVWISKTLPPKRRIAPSRLLRELTIAYLGSLISRSLISQG